MAEDDGILGRYGYCEMYEWATGAPSQRLIGRVVQFDPESPGKIRLAIDNKNLIGITSVNATIESDNPTHWPGENIRNEYGDAYLKKERLAVGEKRYDNNMEISYICTRPWEHMIPIKSQSFNKDAKYVPRTKRSEWVRVSLLGKSIVGDDGTIQPGEYGTLYRGREVDKIGTLIKSESESDYPRYLCLNRISDKTIKIFNKL